jgi:hypothetical protein
MKPAETFRHQRGANAHRQADETFKKPLYLIRGAEKV